MIASKTRHTFPPTSMTAIPPPIVTDDVLLTSGGKLEPTKSWNAFSCKCARVEQVTGKDR